MTARCERAGSRSRVTAHADEKVYRLAAPPCWSGLSNLERHRRAGELAQRREAAGRRLRERTGKPVLGVKKILRVDPHHRPQSFRPTPRPRFHAIEPALRAGLEKAYRRFVDDYRTAAADLLAGRRPNFPAHSFPRPMPFRRGRIAERARGPDP